MTVEFYEEISDQQEISKEVMKKLYDISLNLNQLRSLANKSTLPQLITKVCASLNKDKRVIDMILDEIDK